MFGALLAILATRVVVRKLLYHLGFTPLGIATGSPAAAYHSRSAGVIRKGSLFALLQSLGTSGIGAFGTVAIGFMGALIAVAVLDAVQQHLTW